MASGGHLVTTPLLRRPGPDADGDADGDGAPGVTRAQRIALCGLASLHMLRGLVLMAAPALGLWSGQGPKRGATLLLSALLGVRDVLLGGLLATADRGSRHEMRRALAANLVSDAADAFILIFAAACAWRRREAMGVIGAAAAAAVAEHLTLWSMRDEAPADAGRGEEEQKRRLDMWLADVAALGGHGGAATTRAGRAGCGGAPR